MITSVHFGVRKWEHNPSVDLLPKPKTDVSVTCHPLKRSGSSKAEGLCFIWNLKLTASNQIGIEYESEEYFKITGKSVTNDELCNLAFSSYLNAKQKGNELNSQAEIEATFPTLDSLNIYSMHNGGSYKL